MSWKYNDEIVQFKNTRFLYGPSQYVADYIKKDLNLPNEIKIIETPFELKKDTNDESILNQLKETTHNASYLLFFGTVGLLKGALEIANSVYEILDKYKDVYLVLVGKENFIDNKSPVKNIKEKAKQYKDRVIWYNNLSHRQLFPIIKNAKAVVLPSRIDNLPNTCIEAMGLGKIVIGSRGASFEQLIEDGKNGFLCNANDYKSIITSVDKLMKLSDNDIQNMDKCAGERIKRLSMDNIGTKIIEYYSSVMNEFNES